MKTIRWTIGEDKYVEITLRDKSSGAVLDLSGASKFEFGITESTSNTPILSINSVSDAANFDITNVATGIIRVLIESDVFEDAGIYTAELRVTESGRVFVADRFQMGVEAGVL